MFVDVTHLVSGDKKVTVSLIYQWPADYFLDEMQPKYIVHI